LEKYAMQRALLSSLLFSATTTFAVAGPYEAPPTPPPVIVDGSCSQAFECFYVGLEFGAGESESEFTVPTTLIDPNAEGTFWGGFVGYNFQNGSLIYGGEVRILSLIEFDNGDIQFADLIDVRARVGFAASDTFMVYGAAGYSAGTGEVLDADVYATGFNLGIGGEYDVTESIFVGADVTYRQL